MFLCCECCVLSGRDICDKLIYSSIGVLPTVARRCVWSRNLMNEETLAHCWLLRQKQTNKRSVPKYVIYQHNLSYMSVPIYVICPCQITLYVRAKWHYMFVPN